MTESEDISSASIHSEESLRGTHFEVISPKKHVNNGSDIVKNKNIDKKSGITPYLEITIKELEKFAKVPPLKSEWKQTDDIPHDQKDLQRKGNPEETQEEFWTGSN